jgi:hypothetical protein
MTPRSEDAILLIDTTDRVRMRAPRSQRSAAGRR